MAQDDVSYSPEAKTKLDRMEQDPELKEILQSTVKDLLTTVRENGSISCSEITDQPDSRGGDLWERKYVLLGLHGYYTHVEQDPAVLEAMVNQANCIIEQVGPPPKTRIVDQHDRGFAGHVDALIIIPAVFRGNDAVADKNHFTVGNIDILNHSPGQSDIIIKVGQANIFALAP